MKLTSSWFSLNLDMREWNADMLELCLAEVSAVILKLHTLKLSPEIDIVELEDGGDLFNF